MDAKEFEKLLGQIHTEVEQIENIDEKGIELLRDLNQHISELLARSEDKTIQTPRSTIQQLEESIEHFEVSHPTLTLLLSNFLNSLSSSGI